MTKFIMALFAFGVLSAQADVAGPVSKVSCKKVPVARTQAGSPDEAAINEWLKEQERASGPTNGSVSVTFLGNREYLVCRTYAAEGRQ